MTHTKPRSLSRVRRALAGRNLSGELRRGCCERGRPGRRPASGGGPGAPTPLGRLLDGGGSPRAMQMALGWPMIDGRVGGGGGRLSGRLKAPRAPTGR